ncbi:MAG TPA: hypothetical protein VLD39_16820, partial [Gammaproteobacteria bacterium]|nr:hypothetical protein [Gammaproteobacteria bacterium]
GLAPAAVVAVAVLVMGGGFVRLAGARLQREQRFLGSTFVSESANYTWFAAAVLVWLAGWQAYETPALLVCVAQILLVALGWPRFLAVTTTEVNARMPWVGMLLLAGTNAASLVMLQLERLAIPMFLELEALAQFAVLAIFAMAPFRPLEFSIYRTLLSRLGHASSVDERRRLVVQELRHAAVMLLGMAVLIVLAMPAVVSYLFSGKYDIAWSLALPAVVGAQLRVLRSLVSAAVAALASHRELAIWNVWAWISVVLMLLAGWAGSAHGLVGFLWGVNAGAALNIAVTAPIMLRRLS